MSKDKDNEKIKAGHELLRAVETLNRERGIPSETAFDAIERAIRLAIAKHEGDEENITVTIDRQRGFIQAHKGEKIIDPHAGSLGRIAAQAAKQQMIQLFREEESQTLLSDMTRLKDQLLPQPGTIQRVEGGAAIVSIGKTEAILPRGEQIPGETPHIGSKIKALVLDVKKSGNRVKVILSRTNPLFVQRLFEREIPEIEDRTITIQNVAREAGYRTKVAVSSIDSRVDCVGACVGVRGSRIKNIVEELGGVERIDIVRWSDSKQVLIPYALQPAEIEEVFLYERLERAIVLVREDQLSLAIGRRGQNVRLASKLVDWEIEIMTHDELNTAIEKAESAFNELPGMTPGLIEVLIEEGFLSCEDVAALVPAELCEMGAIDPDTAADLIAYADEAASQGEKPMRTVKPKEQAPRQAIPVPPRQPETVTPSARDAFNSLFKDTPEPSEASTKEPETPPVLPSAEETPADAEKPAEPVPTLDELMMPEVPAEQPTAVPASATEPEPTKAAAVPEPALIAPVSEAQGPV